MALVTGVVGFAHPILIVPLGISGSRIHRTLSWCHAESTGDFCYFIIIMLIITLSLAFLNTWFAKRDFLLSFTRMPGHTAHKAKS